MSGSRKSRGRGGRGGGRTGGNGGGYGGAGQAQGGGAPQNPVEFYLYASEQFPMERELQCVPASLTYAVISIALSAVDGACRSPAAARKLCAAVLQGHSACRTAWHALTAG